MKPTALPSPKSVSTHLLLHCWCRVAREENGGLSGVAGYAAGEVAVDNNILLVSCPASPPERHLLLLQAEQHKAVFNELVSLITNKCFDKCVGSPGKSLSNGEQACVSQCTLRFLETNQVILQRLQQQK